MQAPVLTAGPKSRSRFGMCVQNVETGEFDRVRGAADRALILTYYPVPPAP